jgi:hypothetical protein
MAAGVAVREHGSILRTVQDALAGVLRAEPIRQARRRAAEAEPAEAEPDRRRAAEPARPAHPWDERAPREERVLRGVHRLRRRVP